MKNESYKKMKITSFFVIFLFLKINLNEKSYSSYCEWLIHALFNLVIIY